MGVTTGLLELIMRASVTLPRACRRICTDEDRQTWLAARRQFITATAAPVILGISPWKTREQLWTEMSGDGEDRSRPRTQRMRWGLRLEPAILAGYGEDHAVEVRLSGELLASTERPWAACTLDGWEVRDDELVPIEVKCVDARSAQYWGDGPPPVVTAQVQHQLMVTGLPRARVLAMIGGNELRVFTVERDDAFIERLAEEEVQLWRAVRAASAVREAA